MSQTRKENGGKQCTVPSMLSELYCLFAECGWQDNWCMDVEIESILQPVPDFPRFLWTWSNSIHPLHIPPRKQIEGLYAFCLKKNITKKANWQVKLIPWKNMYFLHTGTNASRSCVCSFGLYAETPLHLHLNSEAALIRLIGDFNGYSPTNHRHIAMVNLDCLLDGL